MKKTAIVAVLIVGISWFLNCFSQRKVEAPSPVGPVVEKTETDEDVSLEEAGKILAEEPPVKKLEEKEEDMLAESVPAEAPSSPAAGAYRAKVKAAEGGGRVSGAPPRSAGVKAGASDDNRQFNHYLDYLEKFSTLPALKLDVSNRIVFKVVDRDGKSIPNCLLTVVGPKGKKLIERRTYADGRAMFFPSEEKRSREQGIKVRATCGRETIERALDPHGEKQVEIRFEEKREEYLNVPLDIAFLLDTTGSMGDEIARLKQTIEVIHFQISRLTSAPDVRFGMVLYRDRGDDYVTRVVPFTADMEMFKSELGKVRADGGGDGPEDLQSGLRDALDKLDWRNEGIRLMFVIADAPPHLDYGQQYTYLNAMDDAARKAIKMVSIGASGLPNLGEYVFRQLAQYTMGIFVFLTYGETGEAEGGYGTTAVSHHTGSNWQSENLEVIVVRMVKIELSHLTDQPVTEGEEYLETTPPDGADRDKVLEELFSKAVDQLIDFSIVKINEKTPTVLIPVVAKEPDLKAASELLEDRLAIVLFKESRFKTLERENIQQLIQEMSLQLSDLFDEKKTVEVGKMAGAELAVIAKLSRGKEMLEMFIKLVWIETAEILSVALVKITPSLVE